GDGFLAKFPAQQNNLAVHAAGKIEQSNVEIFYLNAGSIDFRHRVFHALHGLLPLRLASRQTDNVQQSAAVEKHLVSCLLKLGVNLLNELLPFNGGAEKGFE